MEGRDSFNIYGSKMNWGAKMLGGRFDIRTANSQNHEYNQASALLCRYKVHFPKTSNINILISIMLHKFRVKSIFYESSFISQDDIERNAYLKNATIGKDIVIFLQDELGIDTVTLSALCFDANRLTKDEDIVVNSEMLDWVDCDPCITVNTWDYRNSRFDNLRFFDMRDRAIFDEFNSFDNEIMIACKCIEDMIYSTVKLVS